MIVQGIVQGVGIRPFVYGQALRWGLVGFVLNNSLGVTIEVEGPAEALDGFQNALREYAPPLARIDSVVIEQVPPCYETSFVIAQSQTGSERLALISPDTATCDDCLQELFDPSDRRYGYPFINCTNCGPRFTIVQDVPYDRDKTTMRVFPMCPACQAEYDDPLNRRFHAQPNACPVCGPQVSLVEVECRFIEHVVAPTQDVKGEADPIVLAAQRLVAGAILAIKGLGGYHLACDALNAEAVQRLRQRKHREARPFALMVPDLETARQLCQVSDAEARLLSSQRRPIVLLNQLPDCPVAPAVAPAYNTLGIMLPYTPLHYLLLSAFAAHIAHLDHRGPIMDIDKRIGQAGRPLPPLGAINRAPTVLPDYFVNEHNGARTEPGRPAVLVMTSGNLSDEPIAYRDDDARERLASIAEGMLTHNRDIHMRCDDSLVRIIGREGIERRSARGAINQAPTGPYGGEQFFRRSRGYAPEPITLSFDFPVPLLACGGHLKNTFCLGKGRQAFVSHHIGDLENLETLTSFREGIEHFQRLFDIQPEAIAYDLHPEYLATKYALNTDIPQKIAIQHHHAHIASVLAEHGLSGPVIGVAADGTGYGTDGAVWGCELMAADLLGFERLAHLTYVPLPGGEQAVRQPWRMAAVYLQQAYGDAFLKLDIPFVHQLDRSKWRILAQMMKRGLNSPLTSSLGRLFDAVAALIGIRRDVLYEGQAAIELEMLAVGADLSTPTADLSASGDAYPFAIGNQLPTKLDVAPMIHAIVRDLQQGVPQQQISVRFHYSIAALLATACLEARKQTGLNIVALSGGVFQNRLLLEQLIARLEEMAFQVYINRRVPPNDGGLSLGQAAIAAALLSKRLQQTWG